jgi:acyl-CoA hydrolase
MTPSRRDFQSHAEYVSWAARVVAFAAPRPVGAALAPSDEAAAALAPLLFGVDPMANHLEIYAAPADVVVDPSLPRSYGPSLIEVRYPLATDAALRYAVSDTGDKTRPTFRMSKYLEAVDALAGDVSFRHCDSDARGLAIVTAGHYHCRALGRIDLDSDLLLRSYVTGAGHASLEVRTDALQVAASGEERLVMVCDTVMVCLNKETLRPTPKFVSGDGGALVLALAQVPPLAGATTTATADTAANAANAASKVENVENDVIDPIHDTEDRLDLAMVAERASLAAWHGDIRRKRLRRTMQLRLPLSLPPELSEMAALHEAHRRYTLDQGRPASSRPLPPRTVGQFTFRSSFVAFPEQRNVFGKVFGGFVAGQAANLATYAATFFVRGAPLVSLGVDEAVFLQPIAIGDMVTFTARVAHASHNTCRVFVTVEVRDPLDPGRLPKRSNRLIFVFANGDEAENATCSTASGGSGSGGGGVGGDASADEDAADTAEAQLSAKAPPPEVLSIGRVLPLTYSEGLMHFEASRRARVEGPGDVAARAIVRAATLDLRP